MKFFPGLLILSLTLTQVGPIQSGSLSVPLFSEDEEPEKSKPRIDSIFKGKQGARLQSFLDRKEVKKNPESMYNKVKEVPLIQQPKDPKKMSPEEILALFDWEPGIDEIQISAQHYADVNPGLIRNWRKQAAIKEYLPDVSVNYKVDQTDDAALSSSGVPTESRGIGQGITINASWDLAELMFNREQIAINNESSDLVKLRDDVLDEVTKIYFDRRKLQVTILINKEEDVEENIKRELRLRELTANIDALTGGFFSRELKSRKKVGNEI